jgi:Asp-tRNA(Asn)/Glu-tRNA(Gln) amidotransferase A subunit family amidase
LPHSGLTDSQAPNAASLQCWIQTIGALARSAGDLAVLVDVMQGADAADAHSVQAGLIAPSAVDVTALRCAWFDGDGTVSVRPDLVAAVQEAAAVLASRGLTVAAERPPGFERLGQAMEGLRAAEGLPDHRALVAGRTAELTTIVREALEQADPTVSLSEYRQLSAEADQLRAQVLGFMLDWPILLLPVGALPAFRPEQREFEAERTPARRSHLETCCRAVSRPFHDAEVLAVAMLLEAELGRWQGGAR